MARILDSLQGHSQVIATLEQSLISGRFPMTSIFSGPSGIGKKLAALGLVQALVCESRGASSSKACGVCGACLRVEAQQSEALMIVEPSGTQIKIERAQEILRFLNLQKLGKARAVIIDQAHLLNPQASNALLKSIEEPAPGNHFFLMTSNPSALLPTIRSRSQVFRFAALGAEELKKIGHFEEWVIRSSQGSVEVAQQLASEESNSAQLRLEALKIFSEALSGRANEAALKEFTSDKMSALFLVRCWLTALRDFSFSRAGRMDQIINSDQPDLVQWGSKFEPEQINELAQALLQIERDIHGQIDRQLSFENFWYLLKRSTASHARISHHGLD